MSLLDGMKDKLGFGTKPEWEDDGYSEEESEDYTYDDKSEYGEYSEGEYDESAYEEGDGYSSTSSSSGSVVSFDAYNPSNFDNVKISSDNSPRVASYDDLGKSKSRFSSRTAGGYSSGRAGSSRTSRGSSRSRTSDAGSTGASSGSSWTPSDPSFLDNQGPTRGSRDVMEEIHAADPYSSLGSDFLNASRDPATHLEIVRPGAYGDVEKIATAAKAGKSVVLVVADTQPPLAKRILDFSFGVASALNMNVDKAADRVFVLSRGAEMLSEDERGYLVEQGILKQS